MKPNHVYTIKEFKCNYDGDTYTLRLDCGFGLRYTPKQGCRLSGADTPEMKGGTDTSKAAAKLAKDYAHDFIEEAIRFDGVFVSDEVDKYGRPLGDIQFRDGRGHMRSLASELVRESLAVFYHGQNKNDVANAHAENFTRLKAAGKL